MTHDEFIEKIEAHVTWAQETQCYDISIFKIWIAFEKFLIRKFIDYATGEFDPTIEVTHKIRFLDSDHLKKFLSGDRQYVEYLKKIENLSDAIFYNNPFKIIIEDVHKQDYCQVYAIRNHIAHESEESENKFKKLCLNQNETIISVNEYLQRRTNRRNPTTNFSRLVKSLKDIAEFIEAPNFR